VTSRYEDAPPARIGWRARLIGRIFGRKRMRVLGVAVGHSRPPAPQVLGLIVASFHDGNILTTVYLTPPEAIALSEELTRQVGLQSIVFQG
jgi:hypothetical protein